MYEVLANIADWIGISGVIMILVAYFLLSTGRWIADSMIYQSLNFVGAWLILFSLYFHWNLSSVVIEIAWVTISLMGMYRARKIKT
jgi:hypothetical protein